MKSFIRFKLTVTVRRHFSKLNCYNTMAPLARKSKPEAINAPFYVIERILERKLNAHTRKMEYRIKWLGYDRDEDQTWEPERNLETIKYWLVDFNRAEDEKEQHTWTRVKYEQLKIMLFSMVSRSLKKNARGTSSPDSDSDDATSLKKRKVEVDGINGETKRFKLDPDHDSATDARQTQTIPLKMEEKDDRIAILESNLLQANDEYAAAVEKLTETPAQLSSYILANEELNKSMPEKQTTVEKLQKDIRAVREQNTLIEKEVNELHNQLRTVTGDLNKVKLKLVEHQQKNSKLESNCISLMDQIEDAQDRIHYLERGNSNLRKMFDEKADELRSLDAVLRQFWDKLGGVVGSASENRKLCN